MYQHNKSTRRQGVMSPPLGLDELGGALRLVAQWALYNYSYPPRIYPLQYVPFTNPSLCLPAVSILCKPLFGVVL